MNKSIFEPFKLMNGRFVATAELGRGAQGPVFRGEDRDTNEPIALKAIYHEKSTKKLLEREIQALVQLNDKQNDNILLLRGVVSNTNINGKAADVLAYEIAEKGTLLENLMYCHHFDDVLARTYFRQLLNALTCIHALNIYHRDIKSENILLSSTYVLKLADFGFVSITQDANVILTTQCGSLQYAAPEIKAGKGYNGAKVDIWSAGVVLFMMLCGTPPFREATQGDWWFDACSLGRYDLFWAAHLRYATHMTDNLQAQDLLNRIFVPNPDERITLEEILQHEWMTGPILSDDELQVEMNERFTIIQDTLAEQRAAVIGVKRLRDEDDFQPNKSFNPFDMDSEAHRGVATQIPPYNSTACVPSYVVTSVAPYRFYAYGAKDIIQRVIDHLRFIDPTATMEADMENYIVSSTITLESDPIDLDNSGNLIPFPAKTVGLSIQIFQAPDNEGDDDLLMVIVKMKSGAINDFHFCLRTLRSSMLADAGVYEDGTGNYNSEEAKKKAEDDAEAERKLCEEFAKLRQEGRFEDMI